MGMYIHPYAYAFQRSVVKEYNHIGVGFCVARSTVMGDARASKSGTSNSTDSALFLCEIETMLNQVGL
jgi:hypothetical protein